VWQVQTGSERGKEWVKDEFNDQGVIQEAVIT